MYQCITVWVYECLFECEYVHMSVCTVCLYRELISRLAFAVCGVSILTIWHLHLLQCCTSWAGYAPCVLCCIFVREGETNSGIKRAILCPCVMFRAKFSLDLKRTFRESEDIFTSSLRLKVQSHQYLWWPNVGIKSINFIVIANQWIYLCES